MTTKRSNAIVTKVKDIYDGGEGALWELVMGRHIHIGGFYSSQELATSARITPEMKGIDLCCNNGEGMRFLVRNRGVTSMSGVELSPVAVQHGIQRCINEGFGKQRIQFTNASVTNGLPMFKDNTFDFVWGEDAWCYIPNKAILIETAVRILKPGGKLVFSDWIKGPNHEDMTEEEYQRYLKIMTFPNVESVESYVDKIEAHGCDIIMAKDSGRFTKCIKLYLDMMELQLKGDVLDIYGGDTNTFEKVLRDFHFMYDLAKRGKVSQGLFIAQKKGEKKANVTARSKL